MFTSALEKNLINRVAVGDMLRRRARDSGDKVALVDYPNGERREYTYGALNRKVNQLVRGLRSRDVKQGDKLALISSNQSDMMAVYFACYKMGVVIIPINFVQSPDDICYNLAHSGSSVVVYDPLLETLAMQCVEGLASIKLTVNMGSNSAQAHCTLDELADNQSADEIEDCIINERDTAQMMYTSGTTSRPKAVETAHLALVMAALTGAVELGIKKDSAHLIVLPLFHVAAISLALPTLFSSGTVIIHSSFDPLHVLHSIESERVDSALFLPMMWNALLLEPSLASRDLSSFEVGMYAMAPMDSTTLNKVRETFGCLMHLGSGQTEFAPSACLYLDKSPTEFGEGNYWGTPVCTVDQAIIDDNGNECAPGEIGEICWRGAQAMTGYYNNPEATAEASKFGWHHSGDLGLIDNEGQLLFLDRKKDTIKSGGENVSSMKVEQTLLGMPEVIQAAAFAVPHPHWGEAVCACVVTIPSATICEEDIVSHCKRELGKFEVPKRVMLVDQMPLTGTGKIRKVELRQQYQNLFYSTEENG